LELSGKAGDRSLPVLPRGVLDEGRSAADMATALLRISREASGDERHTNDFSATMGAIVAGMVASYGPHRCGIAVEAMCTNGPAGSISSATKSLRGLKVESPRASAEERDGSFIVSWATKGGRDRLAKCRRGGKHRWPRSRRPTSRASGTSDAGLQSMVLYRVRSHRRGGARISVDDIAHVVKLRLLRRGTEHFIHRVDARVARVTRRLRTLGLVRNAPMC